MTTAKTTTHRSKEMDETSLPHPGTFTRGDRVMFDGHTGIRGKRSWTWTNHNWFERLFDRESDESITELLLQEWPNARITWLNPDRSAR